MRLAACRALAMPGERPFTLWRFVMIKTLIAVAVAGAFALPVAAAASASGDNLVIAQSASGALSSDSASGATANTRFSELDKNNDGKLSPEEYGELNASARGAAGTTAGATGTGRTPGKASGDSSSTGANTK